MNLNRGPQSRNLGNRLGLLLRGWNGTRIAWYAALGSILISEQELKGIGCTEKLKAMQNYFREHPDVYAEGMTIFSTHESPVLTVSRELDDGNDLDTATEPPEAAAPTTEDTSLDEPTISLLQQKYTQDPPLYPMQYNTSSLITPLF